MEKITFYLAKQGKISGAFSKEEVSSFQRNGEIENYSWIWDSLKKTWYPVDPPPSLDPTCNTKIQPEIEVICHDTRMIVSGRLGFYNEHYGELKVYSDETPCFGKRTTVYLNLFNSKTCQTAHTVAQVTAIVAIHKGWSYRLNWNKGSETLNRVRAS